MSQHTSKNTPLAILQTMQLCSFYHARTSPATNDIYLAFVIKFEYTTHRKSLHAPTDKCAVARSNK